MGSAFTLKIDANGIGQLLFDLPDEKVNKFSSKVIQELEEVIDDIATHKDIRALIIASGKKDIFIAGADVHELEKSFLQQNAEDASKLIKDGHRVFMKISQLPYPTIALINGACFGGGTELALACTYRVVTDNPKTAIGLPEVNLGIFPGWGGTQRLPRLIGLIEGMQMVLTGKPINAQKAFKVKFADAIIPFEFAEIKISEFVSFILTPKGRAKILERRQQTGMKSLLLEKNPIGRAFLFYKAKKDVLAKTKGHYPSPLVALDLIKHTYTLPLEEGLQKEIQTFQNSAPQFSANAPNLMQVFFTSESLKKDAGIPVTAAPRKISSAGVIGAGAMGAGITWLLSNNYIRVRMKDINWDFLVKGYATINNIYKKLIKIKKMKPNEANLKFHHVSGTMDYSGYKTLDIVIEAATENLELKNKIFAEVEEVIDPKAILATNTSSLTVEEMASKMKHPERFLGLHFFNPVDRMPLVEVVPGKQTLPEVVATAIDLCRKLGKTPIVVGDCHGFLVNRIFMMAALEGMWLFQEGVEMKRLEHLVVGFGMPMGPFELGDEVGNDVSYHVGKTFVAAYGDRFKGPRFIDTMYDNKLFGKKVGKGFYIYSGKERKVNPDVLKYPSSESSKNLSDQDIIDRILFSMVNESARCLQEKIVSRPDYLDMALILGTGFPPFRGGVLRYADSRGIDVVVDRLQQFSKTTKASRFTPCDYLLDMQKSGKKFYNSKAVPDR